MRLTSQSKQFSAGAGIGLKRDMGKGAASTL
jgi:hypothetical protein